SLLVGWLQCDSLLRHTFIPKDRAQLRSQMFHHQPQRFREPENRIGWFAPRVRQILDGKKRAINVVMTVNQKQLHLKTGLTGLFRFESRSSKIRYWSVTQAWQI